MVQIRLESSLNEVEVVSEVAEVAANVVERSKVGRSMPKFWSGALVEQCGLVTRTLTSRSHPLWERKGVAEQLDPGQT